MAIVVAELTSNTSSGLGSYTTASISPAANALILVAVYSQKNGGSGTTPTITGDSMTWVQIANEQTASPAGYNQITLFRSMSASPGSGGLTIDFASQAQDQVAWSVMSATGTDITGANGAGAIVQSAVNRINGSTGGITVTLGAFSSGNNGTLGAFGFDSDTTITPGSGFSQVTSVTRLFTEFDSANNTSVSISHAVGSEAEVGIAIEIKAAPVSTTGVNSDYSFLM